jgi:hypothetical protein
MSAWRRYARVYLPDYRQLVDRAESPMALWRDLYSAATNACAQRAVDSDLLRRIVEYARACRASPADDVRVAVRSEFFERLFDDAGVRSTFQSLLTETEFRAMEPLLSSRFSPDQYAALQTDFYRTRAEVEAGTTLAKLRQIKDEILDASLDEHKVSVRRAWTNVLGLLEVHEDLIAVENFIDNLYGVPISPGQDAYLKDLLSQVGGPAPRQTGGPNSSDR